MSSYLEDLASLRALPRRGLALYATGCLARVAPVVDALGTSTSSERLAEAVHALWAAQGELPSVEADACLLAYAQAPENAPDVESADDPRYWVMSVLAMLADAVHASCADRDLPEDVLPSVAVSGLELLGNLDAVRADHGGPAYQDDGPEELAEIAAREECLRILHADHPPAEQAARIRALSEQRARELPVPTPEQVRGAPSSE